jgi:TPR repeat protein
MVMQNALRAVVALCTVAVLVMAGAPAAAKDGPSRVRMSDATSRLSDAAFNLVAKDPAQARRLMEQAAASGDADALANLAVFMVQGVGKPADPEGGRRTLELAIAAGSNVGRASLALILLEEKDEAGWRRALDLLREAAEDPLVRALTLYPMGLAKLFGRGVPQDQKAGMDLLQESLKVDPENSDALYLVARAYQNGLAGRLRDPGLAAALFRRSGERGDVRAARESGMAFLRGEGVAADGQAAAMFRQAAQAGYPLAMIDLAVMLATGEAGTRKDPAEAREWYRKAAMLGSSHALRSLGAMLYVGEGGETDELTGWAYLELAAEAGNAAAAAFMQNHAPPDPVSRGAVDQLKTDWRATYPALRD